MIISQSGGLLSLNRLFINVSHVSKKKSIYLTLKLQTQSLIEVEKVLVYLSQSRFISSDFIDRLVIVSVDLKIIQIATIGNLTQEDFYRLLEEEQGSSLVISPTVERVSVVR
jgi:hypothetical protein